ncbi:MAG: isoleucine--tRNA ligase [Candidatus Portnoybacteria bacterium CG23_combo_of_CG06-09_8_20_14_all_37_13]|uniref:isoleucine--tRNA ligase n=1 Tax=Candidatus Portnoybacteria bacterium CG23_combo_of_CG06-09_8_20_14_all_37_13 TaxID=1974819 RepID=A0A2G9YEE3_9BACT|nr:MAG: isoleucine--tRNA ligase [Candidatus Portnoybacteria bacterium CG23_combo_of_CG06-09_8_20_14_all_37_13]
MKNFAQLEEKILEYWHKNKAFEKSVKNRSKTRSFVFYEGPPTANAKPGIHHVLARVFKDLFCRYKTMQGFRVERLAGWDTHGLPVELQIEKKLGFKNRQDIENYGIAKFNKLCRESVWEFKKNWEDLTKRMGYWLDLKNPYITYENEYIQKVWQVLKKIWDKKLLVQDYKVVPWCPRCGTALSSHEVAQGYKKIKEKSIYVKFKLKTDNCKLKTILVWTTTPWTLPANVALAVNPKDKRYKNLIGLEYEPPYSNKGPHKIFAADFVDPKEGTGIVHIAPAYGEDDLNLAKKENLPVVHVDIQDNKKIIEDLEKRGLLEKTEIIEHEYPFCWRCDTALIYYAKKSWFIKMSKLKTKLIKNNQKINWHPAYLKNGRFGEWLKDVKDWALSRERYWGTPLPIWICKKCKKQKMIIKNLKLKIKNLHRPDIDRIKFVCECGGQMQRVPDVIDCWFDSGAMPFASKTQGYPADFICEAIDQTRGWFYTLLAIAACLDKESPYKNVVSLGLVLDKEGKKMSKSKGNVVIPEEVINQYGVDSLRWYFYTINQAGEAKKFDTNDVKEKQNKIISTLWNSFIFLKDYAQDNRKTKNVLDKWILSRLNETIKETTRYLDKYDAFHAGQVIEDFIDDLSNWYIRRSRKDCNKQVLEQVLSKTAQIMAPFTPFISEEIYPDVHLSDWPKAGKIDVQLNKQMQEVREICAKALALRAKAGIKVRQVLGNLVIAQKTDKELLNLIRDEVNVKKIVFGKIFKLDTKITPKLKAEGEERELIRKIQEMRKKAGLKIADKIVLSYPEEISDFVKRSVGAAKTQKGALDIKKL